MDLSGAQNLNIIGKLVVYGLFKQQVYSNKMKLKQAAHKILCLRVYSVYVRACVPA
jgi:hypothetical protein